jgi:hypothetical protein
VRFYAGAPLKTQQGNILGTLCILDHKPRTISDNQKQALQLLAKKAMDYLDTRKIMLAQDLTIGSNAAYLKKLTDQAPGAIFQMEMTPDGKVTFPFMSEGIKKLLPGFDLVKTLNNPDLALDFVHSEISSCLKKACKSPF